MQRIIGRQKEISDLNEIYSSVYGRRRVGKTFLIRGLFEDKFTFYHTGLSPIDADEKSILRSALGSFASSLRSYGMTCGRIENWLSAFDRLKELLLEKFPLHPSHHPSPHVNIDDRQYRG